MGAGREDAAALTESAPGRAWPLIVRRAREEDRDAVLGFASRTWDDWDYIPNAWPEWIHATDGAFLVAAVGDPGGVDAEGQPLRVGQVVAITRVAMVSPTEAWLEGIRVDPRVRGLGVAADLQVAELQWVAAQDAQVLRYATGAENEASHRLGARDDINLVGRFRSWWWDPTGSIDEDHDAPTAFHPDVRSAATESRQEALGRLSAAGVLVSASDDLAALWSNLDVDANFNAGLRLYEPRAWAMQELNPELFRRHVERGEVAFQRDESGLAIGIIVREQLPSEDSDLRFALVAGEMATAVALVDRTRQIIDRAIRFRVERDSPLNSAGDALNQAGYVTPEWEMHILAREMSVERPIPPVDPARLILAERPDGIEPIRW